MGIGADLKASVDALRDELGSDCTYNGVTALGKCAIHDLSPAAIRELVSGDFEDELDRAWAMIEAPAEAPVRSGGRITIDATDSAWVIRRVSRSMCGGVVMALRCLCVAEAI